MSVELIVYKYAGVKSVVFEIPRVCNNDETRMCYYFVTRVFVIYSTNDHSSEVQFISLKNSKRSSFNSIDHSHC